MALTRSPEGDTCAGAASEPAFSDEDLRRLAVTIEAEAELVNGPGAAVSQAALRFVRVR